MTIPQSKTLQIFLLTSEPHGVWIAKLTTRIVQAALIQERLKLTLGNIPEGVQYVKDRFSYLLPYEARVNTPERCG